MTEHIRKHTVLVTDEFKLKLKINGHTLLLTTSVQIQLDHLFS